MFRQPAEQYAGVAYSPNKSCQRSAACLSCSEETAVDWDERFNPPGMRRQAKVPGTNRKIVQVGDMSALAPHLHKAGMIVALFFDPTCDVGGTPAGGNNQVRPGWSGYSRLRSLQTKARCANIPNSTS